MRPRTATPQDEARLLARVGCFEPVVEVPGSREMRVGMEMDECCRSDRDEQTCLHLGPTPPGVAATRRRRWERSLWAESERTTGPKAGPWSPPRSWRGAEVIVSIIDEGLELPESDEDDDGQCSIVTHCNEPLTLGNNDAWSWRDAPRTPGRSDALDACLKLTPFVTAEELRSARQGSRSPAGTASLPCVVCGSDVRVNAAMCMDCAYVAGLVRRHYPTRVLQLEDDDDA